MSLKNYKVHGRIIALDILPMDALPDVDFILGDFREDEVLQQLMNLIPERGWTCYYQIWPQI